MWKMLEPVASFPPIFDYRTLRLFIGLIAVALPIALPILAGHISFDQFLRSMSAYYHDKPRDVFVGSLMGIAILLFAYNGKGPLDMKISKVAGIFCLGVAFFPTTPEMPTPYEQTLGVLHNICAFGLFSMLVVFCLFLFPNSPRFMPKDDRTAREARRDVIYHVCGWLIVACIVLIFISNFMSEELQQRYKPVFFLEWIALTAFGISWFTAGKYGRIKFLVDEKDAHYFAKKSH